MQPPPTHADSQGDKWLNRQDLATTGGVITVHFTCSDPDDTPGTADSVKFCPQDLVLPAFDGKGQTFNAGPAEDFAGNKSAPAKVVINVDRIPPTIPAPSLTPAPNSHGWNNSSVSVAYAPSDTGSQVSLRDSSVEVDGTLSPGVSVVVPGEGKHSVKALVLDFAGNQTISDNKVVNIDLTPPVFSGIGLAVSPNPNLPSTQVTGTVTDNLSGIDPQSLSCTFAVVTVPAIVSGNQFTCDSLPLSLGSNRILIGGKDLAGNSAVTIVNISY